MSKFFINGAPMSKALGIDDNSIVTPTPTAPVYPQHVPISFFMAEKGTTERFYGGAGDALVQFGNGTFDSNDKFYNHVTKNMVDMFGAGNMQVLQRVVADNAKKANLAIYIDMVACDVPNYVRNSDGTIAYDGGTGLPKVVADPAVISGYKYKFVTEYVETVGELGLLTTKPGTFTVDGTTSTMYPLFETAAASEGAYYNNLGLSINTYQEPSANIIAGLKTLPYGLSLFTRDSADSSATVFKSLFKEPEVTMVLKPKTEAVNPDTDAVIDMRTIMNSMWSNTTDELKPLMYKNFADIKVYQNNLDTVHGLILAAEKAKISAVAETWDDAIDAATLTWYDFTTADSDLIDNESYLINIFTGKSSKNVSYHAFVPADEASTLDAKQKIVNVSRSTPIFMNGGADGDIDNDTFEALVVKQMDAYLDSDSVVMDTAKNVESILYDTGFSKLETKKALAAFITVRKDTALALSTRDAQLGEKHASLSEQRAIAVSLYNRLKLAPESEYFGTPVSRAIIIGGSGFSKDPSITDRVPLISEMAYKSSRFMGAGDGKWKKEFQFNSMPNSKIELLTDIEPAHVPNGIKPLLWSDGLVWPQPIDRINYAFTSMNSVYNNDTSILNNWFVNLACCTISKVADEAYRLHTGIDDMSDDMFKTTVETYVAKRLNGIFAGKYVIIPEVSFLDEEVYAWQLITKIGAEPTRTAMVHRTEAYNASDLA